MSTARPHTGRRSGGDGRRHTTPWPRGVNHTVPQRRRAHGGRTGGAGRGARAANRMRRGRRAVPTTRHTRLPLSLRRRGPRYKYRWSPAPRSQVAVHIRRASCCNAHGDTSPAHQRMGSRAERPLHDKHAGSASQWAPV